MRQPLRFFVKPGTFFNQLQWSPHHWFIMVFFLGLAVVETQVGKESHLYHSVALFLQNQWELTLNQALWIIMASKLVLMVFGALLISWTVWAVGSIVGKANSRRVLFRRLAVVFTVLLAGFTLQHLAANQAWLQLASLGLYAWGLLLGYLAIREQFELNHLETTVVALFAFLLTTTSWHFAHHIFAAKVHENVQALTKSSKSPVDLNKLRMGTDF